MQNTVFNSNIQISASQAQDYFPTKDEFKQVLIAKKFYEDNYADIKANPDNYKTGSN